MPNIKTKPTPMNDLLLFSPRYSHSQTGPTPTAKDNQNNKPNEQRLLEQVLALMQRGPKILAFTTDVLSVLSAKSLELPQVRTQVLSQLSNISRPSLSDSFGSSLEDLEEEERRESLEDWEFPILNSPYDFAEEALEEEEALMEAQATESESENLQYIPPRAAMYRQIMAEIVNLRDHPSSNLRMKCYATKKLGELRLRRLQQGVDALALVVQRSIFQRWQDSRERTQTLRVFNHWKKNSSEQTLQRQVMGTMKNQVLLHQTFRQLKLQHSGSMDRATQIKSSPSGRRAKQQRWQRRTSS